MEIVYSVPTIPCPSHPSQIIQKIDPRPGSPKMFYCSDCILDSENPKSLAGSLQSFGHFLNDAALFYSKNKHEFEQYSDPPVEYAEIISMQGESLDQLTKHVEKQKYIIDDIFNEVKKNILEQIDKKKQEYYQRLDEQVPNICQLYDSLERDLKRNYPQPEDTTTKEDLEKRISRVQNFSQLNSFVKEIRDDINRGNFNKFNSEEAKKKHFDSLLEELKIAISNQPSIDRNNQELKLFYDAIQGNLDQLLNKGLIFKNIVPNKADPAGQKYPESTFIGPEQFKQLRLWLPEKFEFNPRLIYRSSLDGLLAQNFHSKCDGKGPTITVIKCKFQGSQKTSIIGGFIDQSWHQNGWIDSKEAFIFSLTEKIKRNVLDSKRAAFAGSENGPTFGVGHDLVIRNVPSMFYVHPSKSYSLNGEGIINSEVQGPMATLFNPEEIEVYALK